MAKKQIEEVRVGKYKVALSNRHKIYWPEKGYTKGDLVDYIDPSDKNSFQDVVDAAMATKQVLDKAGINHIVKHQVQQVFISIFRWVRSMIMKS